MRWKPTHPGDRDRGPRGGTTSRFRAVLSSNSRGQVIASLDDPSPRVASAAARRLAELDGKRAAPILRAQLLAADLAVVPDIARALRRLGETEAVGVAIAGLHDQRYTERLAAALALGELDDERAVGALCTALRDPIAGVRIAALNALVQLRAPAEAGGACAQLLADANPQVRLAAVRAVARLAAKPGEALAAVADDRDRVVRLGVARHSSALPQPAANSLLADADPRVREAAVQGAGPREIGVLSVLLVEDPSAAVRKAAARRLGGFGDERIADVLVPGLEDPDAVVRAAVLRALERLLTRQGAIERMARELGADRPRRRRATVYALARLHAREPRTAVQALVDDPDPDVRLAVVQTADSLLCDPESAIDYLTSDVDLEVRHAAEMWLLRRRQAAERSGGHLA